MPKDYAPILIAEQDKELELIIVEPVKKQL